MALEEQGVLGDFIYAIWFHEGHGHLCGYLGVPRSHPWYGDHELYDVSVHGGITYTEPNIIGIDEQLSYLRKKSDPTEYTDSFTDEQTGVTFPDMKPMADLYQRNLDHALENAGKLADFPIEGFPFDIWWIGFDCAHGWDSPRPGSDAEKREQEFNARFLDSYPQYKDVPEDHKRTYKDRDYVFGELESLANQAADAFRSSAPSVTDQDIGL